MKDSEKFIEQIEAKAKEWDISAVLSIEDREGFHYERAFGYADRIADRPMTTGERFAMDAESAFFLTLCVMHLAEAKKLRFSDRLSRFIPEYKHAERITVRHLLRFNSGIPDYWSDLRMVELQKDPAHAALSDQERFRREYELHFQDTPVEEVLGAINDLDLTHEPGRDDDGSEVGYTFLAEIVRRVSGLTPREYIFRHFFEPIGMRETRPGDDATAALYGIFRDTQRIRLPRAATSGTFTTTAQDMRLFAAALLEKRFFSEKTWETMLKVDADLWALGFSKRGELYMADFYPNRFRDTCQLWLHFDSGTSILMLQSEELGSKLDESRRWRYFTGDLRRAWQDTRVYPQNPEFKRVNGKNVWDAINIELDPEQLSFVPEASRCVASSLARKQPVYILVDHGVAVGMAALLIEPKKKKYDVAFLQVDRRYQHRGYGRILLTHAIDVLKEKGAEKLEIGVNRFNLPAQRLYRSVGFTDKEVYDEFIEMEMTL